ncbi:hypothetical protein [Flavobacterium sp. N2038]|uniref:hypothetical protein n=1 Tax=Flavobacterium sp. N2038 TaxID=2986829 RepID=UPI0022247D60|nr:hypothetical protein [Flavobacterium sp. N2038]
MKTSIKILAILLFLINYSCQAQQMVQTTKDVYKLKENEQQFINKPLKNLLKEIKPEIKTANGINDNPFFFSFRFRTLEQQKKDEGSYEDSVALYVYVKEAFDWKWEDRPKGKEMIWTKKDAQKYQNLIVVRIKVINLPKE